MSCNRYFEYSHEDFGITKQQAHVLREYWHNQHENNWEYELKFRIDIEMDSKLGTF